MIRSLVYAIVITGLLAYAFVARPTIEPADPGLLTERAPSTFFGCVGRVDRTLDGSAVIGSIVRGPVTAQRANTSSEPVTTQIDEAGGATVPLADLAAAGDVGVLVEATSADAGVAIIEQGAAGALASVCPGPITESAMAIGGSTGGSEGLDLVIANPYSIDAVVSVTSSSEVGDDSARQLASVLVPARSTIVEDLATLLPLRQTLSMRIAVERGAIHAALVQEVEGDVAMIEAVAPGQDWWLPVETVPEVSTNVVVATSSLLPVQLQIDAYSQGSLEESVVVAEIPARGQVSFDATDLAAAPGGLRISSDGPIVAVLVQSGTGVRAATPAVPMVNSEWILPGSGSFEASQALVLNPGDVEAEIVIQPLAPDTPARALVVPPATSVSVPLGRAGAGFLIRSTSEIAVTWGATAEIGRALAAGVPVAILTE